MATRTVLPTSTDEAWVDIRLRDGSTASLRPLEQAETEPVLAVFDGMSDRSRFLRYLTGLPRIPGPMLRMLTDVDGDRHVSWLATVAGEPAGLARYVRLPERPSAAEVAFEVVDRHHGRGLATALLDAVTTVAAARGVRWVQASIDPANTASRRLIGRLGVTARMQDGLVLAEGPLRLLEPAVVDRVAVVRLSCAGGAEGALGTG